MDDILELTDVVAESEIEGAIVWLLRLIGLLALLSGFGLWLLTDMGLLVVPLALIIGGLILLIVPGLLLSLAEVAGG
ncbi:hypothetical protein [Halocatena pleomorpha]|uniref:Major facilitator superfamily (MFS) profile domain-containing protein n=1 Tax=Halocatena pleomorpha TaxID=1785090 RepID=A0A3P3REM1_9EURY|nr:hypothetical protein [Halocatena pleomorpha]RRJ31418.1 hypothetical protein EIK79_06775 [Halocatena pleomorpha]